MAIGRCSCKNEFQNKKYGQGLRVGNPLKSKPGQFHCTVCEKTFEVKGANKAVEEKKGKGGPKGSDKPAQEVGKKQ